MEKKGAAGTRVPRLRTDRRRIVCVRMCDAVVAVQQPDHFTYNADLRRPDIQIRISDHWHGRPNQLNVHQTENENQRKKNIIWLCATAPCVQAKARRCNNEKSPMEDHMVRWAMWNLLP